AGLPAQRPFQDAKSAVWFENGRIVTGDAARTRANFEESNIADPVLRVQGLLKERIGPHAAFTAAVSFARLGRGGVPWGGGGRRRRRRGGRGGEAADGHGRAAVRGQAGKAAGGGPRGCLLPRRLPGDAARGRRAAARRPAAPDPGGLARRARRSRTGGTH